MVILRKILFYRHADFFSQEKYNFALVTNHFSSEAQSLRFGDTLKKIRSVDNFQVRLLDFAFWT